MGAEGKWEVVFPGNGLCLASLSFPDVPVNTMNFIQENINMHVMENQHLVGEGFVGNTVDMWRHCEFPS